VSSIPPHRPPHRPPHLPPHRPPHSHAGMCRQVCVSSSVSSFRLRLVCVSASTSASRFNTGTPTPHPRASSGPYSPASTLPPAWPGPTPKPLWGLLWGRSARHVVCLIVCFIVLCLQQFHRVLLLCNTVLREASAIGLCCTLSLFIAGLTFA
jgi:hypothetical protein